MVLTNGIGGIQGTVQLKVGWNGVLCSHEADHHRAPGTERQGGESAEQAMRRVKGGIICNTTSWPCGRKSTYQVKRPVYT